MEPIGFSKKKASEVLQKNNIDVLIASTPVNVFYLTGLPTLHVAPNPISSQGRGGKFNNMAYIPKC
jgi:hypothetical protein